MFAVDLVTQSIAYETRGRALASLSADSVNERPLQHPRPSMTPHPDKREEIAVHPVLEQLMQHLAAHDVRYRTYDEPDSSCVDFRGEDCTYRLLALLHDEDNIFEVFGCPPFRVPVGARPASAEAVARANYGLQFGKLELDFDDGELRYQVTQVLPDERLTDAVIGRTFGAAIAVLDRYLPALLSVIYGNELPVDAVRRAEQTSDSEAA